MKLNKKHPRRIVSNGQQDLPVGGCQFSRFVDIGIPVGQLISGSGSGQGTRSVLDYESFGRGAGIRFGLEGITSSVPSEYVAVGGRARRRCRRQVSGGRASNLSSLLLDPLKVGGVALMDG